MKEDTIALLRKDMEDEHQAIVQYLLHAYQMGEIPLAFEVEGIARDEMRHLDWLADLITELGGDPSMQSTPPDKSRAPAAEQMAKNVALEEGAIAQYRAHIEAIDDEKVRLVLSRILHDELAHREQFAGFVQEAAAEQEGAPVTESSAEPSTSPKETERLGEILNQGVRHEYTVILQYLYHSFVAVSKEVAEELQNIAINEMQHMGWLAEAAEEVGVAPDATHTELVLTRDMEEALKANIAVEREVTKAYNNQLPEIKDEGLQELVKRIRDHEIYHDASFSDLLDEVEEEEEAQQPPEVKPEKRLPSIPSVGSLIGKK